MMIRPLCCLRERWLWLVRTERIRKERAWSVVPRLLSSSLHSMTDPKYAFPANWVENRFGGGCRSTCGRRW